jgi:hypothetical protein
MGDVLHVPTKGPPRMNASANTVSTNNDAPAIQREDRTYSFENPWKDGDIETFERALVRGGPERPSSTRTPRDRTHHINPTDAAQLLDELFPVGVERIEVRFVYAESSYQKQFLRGRWAVSENESSVPTAFFRSEEEVDSVVRVLNERTTKRASESDKSIRTIGFSPPRQSSVSRY